MSEEISLLELLRQHSLDLVSELGISNTTLLCSEVSPEEAPFIKQCAAQIKKYLDNGVPEPIIISTDKKLPLELRTSVQVEKAASSTTPDRASPQRTLVEQGSSATPQRAEVTIDRERNRIATPLSSQKDGPACNPPLPDESSTTDPDTSISLRSDLADEDIVKEIRKRIASADGSVRLPPRPTSRVEYKAYTSFGCNCNEIGTGTSKVFGFILSGQTLTYKLEDGTFIIQQPDIIRVDHSFGAVLDATFKKMKREMMPWSKLVTCGRKVLEGIPLHLLTQPSTLAAKGRIYIKTWSAVPMSVKKRFIFDMEKQPEWIKHAKGIRYPDQWLLHGPLGSTAFACYKAVERVGVGLKTGKRPYVLQEGLDDDDARNRKSQKM